MYDHITVMLWREREKYVLPYYCNIKEYLYDSMQLSEVRPVWKTTFYGY